MSLWRLKSAIQTGIQRFRYPVLRAEGRRWAEGEHYHICYALRILNTKDFKEVCPLKRKPMGRILEIENRCDFCPYLGIVDFYKDKDNKKKVEFHIFKHEQKV